MNIEIGLKIKSVLTINKNGKIKIANNINQGYRFSWENEKKIAK